ncbi:MAG: hypothetical protein ACLP1X_04310 [Polyangiaceae bacterium]
MSATPTLMGWLRHRLALPSVVAAGVLLAMPSVANGFRLDDHAILLSLESREPVPTAWWDLYRFVPGTPDGNRALLVDGWTPWWSAPGLRLHLLRPLSSALLALDHAVFGHQAIAYHLHALLWFAALLVVVAALFRRLLPPETATLALAIYAFSDANAQIAGWISARHYAVAGVPALLGLLAHIKARTQDWRPGRWLAPLGMAIGLLASECALGVVALAIAYDLLGGPPASLRRRWIRALPALALAGSYLVVYAAVGGGPRDSGEYVSPFETPGAFLGAAATRFPVLMADAILQVPAELTLAGLTGALAVVGVVASLGVLLLARACWGSAGEEERAAMRWSLPGSLAALLVCCGALPGSRLLAIPNVGFAIVLAVLFRHAFSPARFAWARRGFAGLLVANHLVFAPLILVAVRPRANQMIGRAIEDVARAANAAAAGATRVFVLNGSDPMTTTYARLELAAEGHSTIRCWSWLDSAKADARVTRTGKSSLLIEPIGTSLLHGAFDRVYRAPSVAFHPGDVVEQCGARVRVIATEDGRPTRIEVDGALGAPGAAVLVWQGGAMRRWIVPPVGETVVIPWSAGPSKVL